MIKLTTFIIFSLIFMASCKNKHENLETKSKDEIVKSKKSNSLDSLEVLLNKDTIKVGEDFKGVVELIQPYFGNASKVVLLLSADEDFPLKEDLSNEYEIPMEGFQNLTNDTINSKFLSGYNDKKTCAFGISFQKEGDKKIRGYVIEFITDSPPLDSIYPRDKVRKYFFEKQVYVTSN